MECPVRLWQVGIGEDKKSEIAHYLEEAKVSGLHHKLGTEDRSMLVDLMME